MKIDATYKLCLAELEAMAFELLRLEFFEGSSSYKTFVGSRFIWLDRMHLERDFIGRNAEILKLQFLFKHLSELRYYHSEAFKRTRKMIRKAENANQYFGARMEVYAAASLVRHGVEFLSRESPDYELVGEFKGIYLECGSAHIAGNNADLVKKISLSVINKCKKSYANRNTLLMLDITNPMLRGIFSDNQCITDKIRVSVSQAIEDCGYGSVVLLCYGINESVTNISANFIRIDSHKINPRLLQFMEKAYPFDCSAEQPFYYLDQS